MKLENVIYTQTDKTVYHDGDAAIKVFDKHFKKADILNEALNHARAEETELNVPKIFEVRKIDDNWAISMEFIEGETLADLMKKNPEKLEEYINLFVDIQMKIHNQNSPLLTKLKDKMARKISLTKFDATTRYDLLTRLEGMPNHNKVCHGDFRPSNIILTEEGTPYIIDWSHATQGNASADVARTYLIFLLENRLEEAELYLKTFCKKSDTARQYVLKWVPIVAASQSVKGKSEEIELLSKFVSVVDYV